MIYVKDNQFKFYKFKITYDIKQNGLNIGTVDYVDDVDEARDSIYRRPDIYSNFNSEPLIPTPEQTHRLAAINNVNLQYKENYMWDMRLFVEKGVMFNQDPLLKPLADKGLAATINFLVENLKPEIKKLRDEKNNNGIELFGYKFDSNQFARNNVSQYITIAMKDMVIAKDQAKALDAKYIWKDFNDVHRELTFEQICKLADEMGNHMRACFAAEALTAQALSKKSVPELLSFPANKQYNRIGITEQQVTQPGDLAAVYEACYQAALQALREG
jgi:hypothetical protein